MQGAGDLCVPCARRIQRSCASALALCPCPPPSTLPVLGLLFGAAPASGDRPRLGPASCPFWSGGRDFPRGERRGKRERRPRVQPRETGPKPLFLPIPISRQAFGKTKLISQRQRPKAFRDFNPWKAFSFPFGQRLLTHGSRRQPAGPRAPRTPRALPGFEPRLLSLLPALSGPRRALETWRAQER